MMFTKKIYLLVLFFLAWGFQSYAVDRNFKKDYIISPSSANTYESVTALSVMDENLVFQRAGKVFSGRVSENEITKMREMSDLSALSMDGQFTMFANNTIYYSSKGVLCSAVLQNGAWVSKGELKIAGYSSAREMGKGSAFAYRRWQYKGENRKKEHMYNPMLADNGKRLYFSSSELPGGKGGMDIWYIEKNSDGTSWTKPKNFAEVNSSSDEDFPFVVGDTMMFFSSNRKCDVKGHNFYKKRLSSDKAVALVEPIFNSNADESNFVCLNKSVFFLSNRQIKNFIYRMEYQDEDLVDNVELSYKMPTQPNVLEINGNTCTFFAEFDNAKLAKNYEDEFERIYEFINKSSYSRLEIIAYVDEEGDESHNYSVSLRRASTILERLVAMGISEDRITYDGKGNTSPLVKYPRTEADKMKNRRIEIIKK